ncbi:hypothetical protein [Sphingobium lignivorans]|uniref:Uncharacterized protein n=1 Tax=Sphingobium lignivorans TaxID=2735886 RepID=A0ABR6NH91_9SPHN|nr:hypothetical protein [Sphingobium lignivorans]MBB5986002.1 hypothetical protein [Sphingobium lignivorans]
MVRTFETYIEKRNGAAPWIVMGRFTDGEEPSNAFAVTGDSGDGYASRFKRKASAVEFAAFVDEKMHGRIDRSDPAARIAFEELRLKAAELRAAERCGRP